MPVEQPVEQPAQHDGRLSPVPEENRMPRPKRPNGDGTIRPRQRADGTTVWDVAWSYRDADGRPRRKPKKGFRTEREARTFLRRVTSQVDTGSYVPPTNLTLGDWLEEWLEGLRLKPQTIAGYQRDVRRHVVPHIGHLKLADLAPVHLDRLYRTLETTGSPTGKGPLSLSSVRGVHATLCSALTAALRAGVIADSPARRATPPTMKQIKATRTTMTT
jgi:integrase